MQLDGRAKCASSQAQRIPLGSAPCAPFHDDDEAEIEKLLTESQAICTQPALQPLCQCRLPGPRQAADDDQSGTGAGAFHWTNYPWASESPRVVGLTSCASAASGAYDCFTHSLSPAPLIVGFSSWWPARLARSSALTIVAAILSMPSRRVAPNAARTGSAYAVAFALDSRMCCVSLVRRFDNASNRHSNDSVARSRGISMMKNLYGVTARICHRNGCCP